VSPLRSALSWNSPTPEERTFLRVSRPGGLRLTFAAGEERKYDWQNGGVVVLNITELGDILAFSADRNAPDIKIFHDPGLGGQGAGKTRKELIIKRIGGGKPGYFFNFAVNQKEGTEGQKKWSIALTEGEFQVFLTIIQNAIPQLLAMNFKPQIEAPTSQEGAGSK
jgi:hypothetical protein